MRALTSHLTTGSNKPVGTILVIGAGTGAELPAWRALDSRRLILVEALPAQAEQLQRRVDAARHEEVWSRAIVPAPSQQAILHVINNPLHSSVNPPQALAQHYPNLREVSQTEVPAGTLHDAIQALALDTGHAHLLVLDVPGLAHDLLAVTPAQVLQCFTWIVVHCDAEPLYAGDVGAGKTEGLLHTIGFDIQASDEQTIYPRVSMLLHRNDTRTRIAQLEAQAAQLTQQRDDQTKLANQHKNQLDEAGKDLSEKEKLASDLQTQVAQLTQQCDEQAKLADQHKAKLDKANQQAAELQKLADERKALLDKVSQQSQERGARIIQLEKEHVEFSRRQQWLDQEMIKAEAQVDLIKDVLLRDLTS